MPRKQKQKIKVYDSAALEGLMQEVYNDACNGLKDAQAIINEIKKSTKAEDVDEVTRIAKELINAGKQKTDNVKIKLEVAKLQYDSLKQGGDAGKAMEGRYGDKVGENDFDAVRELIKKKALSDDNDVNN